MTTLALYVKNAFLYGDLHEEVYMMLPLVFKILGSEGKVCKLRHCMVLNNRQMHGLRDSVTV